MKKLLAILLLLCLLPLSAMAGERVTIVLPDAEVSFEPFEGGYCLTEETSASVFNRIGLSQRDVLAWMTETNCSALLYDSTLDSEMQVSVEKMNQQDYDAIMDASDELLLEVFRESNEQYGFVVSNDCVYDSGTHRFVRGEIAQIYGNELIYPSLAFVTYQQSYRIQLVMFVNAESIGPEHITQAEQVVNSLRYTPRTGITEIGAHGVTVQLLPPAGMTVHPSAGAAGVSLSPEPLVGEVVGCMADPAGAWYILWQLDESDTGDMDVLSESGVKFIYQNRAKDKRAIGGTVDLTEDYTGARHRYVRLGYSIPDRAGNTWYAESYYTKQSGWGAHITLYSCGAPLTEAQQSMLREIIDSQMISVAE